MMILQLAFSLQGKECFNWCKCTSNVYTEG